MTTIELFLKLVRNALWQTEEGLPEELLVQNGGFTSLTVSKQEDATV